MSKDQIWTNGVVGPADKNTPKDGLAVLNRPNAGTRGRLLVGRQGGGHGGFP